ncbi:MAG: type II CRISPR-associated endonuclease Cas1 [Lactovum sp.]
MTWRNLMIKDGEYLRLKLSNLEVEKLGQRFTIPLSDIATITLEGDIMSVTTKLLAKLAEHNIAVIICNNKYIPCGIFMGFGQYHRTAKRNIEQVAWKDYRKQEIWADIIRQKIQNQIGVLQTFQAQEERLVKMKELYNDIQTGDLSNREGHAAKVYFNTLYGLKFTRDTDCFENSAMNYGYTIIRAYMARLVTSLGLIPTLGVFHHNEFNSFNLVDDLMEPFRPLMDCYIREKVSVKFKQYLSWEARCMLIDFLHQPYLYNGKKSTIDLFMLDYVNSFIKSMQDDSSHLVEVSLGGFRGV